MLLPGGNGRYPKVLPGTLLPYCMLLSRARALLYAATWCAVLPWRRLVCESGTACAYAATFLCFPYA
eukprot:2413968-Rhodomonas_salina.1